MEACFLGKSVPPQEQASSGHPGMSEKCRELTSSAWLVMQISSEPLRNTLMPLTP
jgi:hypothetical protein